ncbi:MAG TPA: hypothetical protein VGD66_03045 [Allosphingosinicella sp.]|jgi:hypothetical protein
MDFTELTVSEMLWTAAALLVLVAAAAAWAEHRRSKRRDIERVGVVPWHLIQILASILAVAAIALAMKG